MKLIDRQAYLKQLVSVIGTPDIKVLTGVRRSGKSKLLEALKDYVTKNVDNHNIIHINFNLPDYEMAAIGRTEKRQNNYFFTSGKILSHDEFMAYLRTTLPM